MKEISVEDLHTALTKDNCILIDVRNPDEYANWHIEKAKLIPLPDIEEHTNEYIKSLKDYNTIYVHCKLGGRGGKACEIFNKKGLHCLNVTGGITAWKEAGFEVIES